MYLALVRVLPEEGKLVGVGVQDIGVTSLTGGDGLSAGIVKDILKPALLVLGAVLTAVDRHSAIVDVGLWCPVKLLRVVLVGCMLALVTVI